MLVETSNNAIDGANDRIDLDEKEITIPIAVVKTASASGGTPYFDSLSQAAEGEW
ncbi:MAG TPA: hypothetical protein VKB06_02890 [Nitrososphaera sp.]|nr:hypothetical protein [Nitrososphaera sp.]